MSKIISRHHPSAFTCSGHTRAEWLHSVRAERCRKLDPSWPSVLACVRLRRTWWCEELQAETRCHAWLGYGYTDSETVRKIAALELTFMSLGWHLPNCTEDRLMQDWKTIVLDRDADKIMSRSIKQLKIQAWCYVWTSDPVSTEMSTAHQCSCLLGLETSSANTTWCDDRKSDTSTFIGRLPNSYVVELFFIIIIFYASVCFVFC